MCVPSQADITHIAYLRIQNNLAELWSLLNFILPDLFTDLDSFQEWFNLSTVTSSDDAPAISERKSQEIVTKLHAILKPFLLRRIKADVETGLPPKKEFVLYTPLSDLQREAYQAVLEGSMRSYLLAKEEEENMKKGIGKFGKGAREKVDVNAPRKTRNKAGKKVKYNVDEDDEAYFEQLEAGEVEDYRETRKEKNVHARDLGNDYLRKLSGTLLT
jgi:ATP-dependent DNA helicase